MSQILTTGFDDYFKELGISTIYNTLGVTTGAVDQYIGLTRYIVNNSRSKRSNIVKQQCYQTLVEDIKPRQKYTGFEQFNSLDVKLRRQLHKESFTKPIRLGFLDEKDYPEAGDVDTYFSEIGDAVIKLADNKAKVLYLSGGLDSELLATILIKQQINFTPIIFEWISNGVVTNAGETVTAFEFCKLHSLVPIVIQCDVDQMWSSDEFYELACDIQTTSPHITTHAYMVDYVNRNIEQNCIHLFGGEIRYISNNLITGSTKQLVYAAKLTKATWVFVGLPGDTDPKINVSYTIPLGTSGIAWGGGGGGGGGGLGVYNPSALSGLGGGGGGGGTCYYGNMVLPAATTELYVYTVTTGGCGKGATSSASATAGGNTTAVAGIQGQPADPNISFDIPGGGPGGNGSGNISGSGGYAYTIGMNLWKQNINTTFTYVDVLPGVAIKSGFTGAYGSGGGGSDGPGLDASTQTATAPNVSRGGHGKSQIVDIPSGGVYFHMGAGGGGGVGGAPSSAGSPPGNRGNDFKFNAGSSTAISSGAGRGPVNIGGTVSTGGLGFGYFPTCGGGGGNGDKPLSSSPTTNQGGWGGVGHFRLICW